jgi:hypothetical protein
MKLAFFETPLFSRQLPIYLFEESYRELQTTLLDNPQLGNVMPGTRRFRKYGGKINSKEKVNAVA